MPEEKKFYEKSIGFRVVFRDGARNKLCRNNGQHCYYRQYCIEFVINN